jgi:hypothetical protein
MKTQKLKTVIVLTTITFSTFAFANDKCRERIQEVACLAEPDRTLTGAVPHNLQKFVQEMECIDEAVEYKNKITEVYDELPQHSQGAFCYLNKIYIIPHEMGFAAAAAKSYDLTTVNYSEDDSHYTLKTDGLILLISEKSLKDKRTIDDFAFSYLTKYKFKEIGIHPEWPFYELEDHSGVKNSSLYYILLHEIGHFFDFAHVDVRANEDFMNESWVKSENGWTPKLNETYQAAEKKYQEEMSMDNVYGVLSGLLRETGFPTFYAMTDPREDFAEHYAALLSSHELNIYRIKAGSAFIPFWSHTDERHPSFYRKQNIVKDLIQTEFNDSFLGKIDTFPTRY